MMLTPVNHDTLRPLLPEFRAALSDYPLAAKVFDRVTAIVPDGDLMTLSTDAKHHADGVELCRQFGFGILDVDPKTHFTWDGINVAIRMEPSVLIHEVAHYQLAAPERRAVLDFGLGCGPESGKREQADAVQTLFCPERDVEEALCSLLGILWEAQLGQPAILAFLEQNWMEGGANLQNVGHFKKIVRWLHDMELIDGDGAPTRNLRTEGDDTFFARWFADNQ